MRTTAIFASFFFLAMPLTAAVIYVDADASDGGGGTSWPDAFNKLQDALGAASSGDKIWIANGVYYPDEGSGQSNDAVASTFSLPLGVEVYGGFQGDEDALGDRDPDLHVAVLSGDIDGDDTDSDGNSIAEVYTDIQGSNAYHVVSTSSVDSSTVLDGVTVTAGYANGTGGDRNGGAVRCSGGSPTLANLVLSGNR